jgi:hypothetical protein
MPILKLETEKRRMEKEGKEKGDRMQSAPPASLQYLLSTQSLLSSFHSTVARSQRIVIVGGGCVAIELAGEIVEKYGKAAVQPPVQPKDITIIHSGPSLMSRQTGLRDKMRETALRRLQSLGVKVVLNERVDMDNVEEHGQQGSQNVSNKLHEDGYIAAESGKSFQLRTCYTKSPPADAFSAASSSSGNTYTCDLILSCTGVSYDPSLFQADAEISTALSEQGRLLVNEFFQLSGKVSTVRQEASQKRALLHAAVSACPSATSDRHSQLSFHYPHIFAIGDCCVPVKEVELNLNPQAYHAHKHGNLVAANIRNMVERYALCPYEGSGPQSVFLSIGSQYGMTQLPNRQQAIVGDRWSVYMKSDDLHVPANWTFLGQDRSKMSFRGGVSCEFLKGREEKAKEGTAHTPSEVATPSVVETPSRDDLVDGSLPSQVSATFLDSAVASSPAASATKPVGASIESQLSPHPADSREMVEQAALVEQKLKQLDLASAAHVKPEIASIVKLENADETRPSVIESLTVNIAASQTKAPYALSPASPLASDLNEKQQQEFDRAMQKVDDEELDDGVGAQQKFEQPQSLDPEHVHV